MAGKYYLIVANARAGPFTRQELEQQPLGRDTLVWCKGIPDWLPAGQMAELLDLIDEPPPLPGTAPLRDDSEQFKEPAVCLSRPELALPPLTDDPRPLAPRAFAALRAPYDRVGMHRLHLASSCLYIPGLLAVLIGAAVATWLGFVGPGGHVPRFDANQRQVVLVPDPGTRHFRMFLAVATASGMVLGTVALLIGIACYCVLLYRAWVVIQDRRAPVTPGRAVGFLFIPFFNAYWFFIAVFGLARALNRFVRRYELEAPTASQALGFALALYLAMMYLPIPFAGLVPFGLLLIVLPFFMRSVYHTTAAICDDANQERVLHASSERLLYEPELTRPLSAHFPSVIGAVLAPIGTAVFAIAFGVSLDALHHYQRDAARVDALRDGIEQLQARGQPERNALINLQQQLRGTEPMVQRWTEELIISGSFVVLGLLLIGIAIGLALAARHWARVSEEREPQLPPDWPLSQGAGLLAKNARSP